MSSNSLRNTMSAGGSAPPAPPVAPLGLKSPPSSPPPLLGAASDSIVGVPFFISSARKPKAVRNSRGDTWHHDNRR
eukprot:1180041-Prorocentrum_minimum.AAC.1